MLSAIDRNPVRNQSEHLSAIAGIRKLGGWKTLSMVLRYVHTNVDEHKDSIDALPGETGGILGDKKNSGGKNRMTINSLGASVRSLHTGAGHRFNPCRAHH